MSYKDALRKGFPVTAPKSKEARQFYLIAKNPISISGQRLKHIKPIAGGSHVITSESRI